jgi:hypothetical protein
MRLTRAAATAVVALTLAGACSNGERPTVGAPVPPTTSTTRPPGNETATTQPGPEGDDPWPDAIDIAPGSDPCALLTDVVVLAVLGTSEHDAPRRDGDGCTVTAGEDELTVAIVGHGAMSREQVHTRYQDSKPELSLDAVSRSPASILYSRAPGAGDTAVFLLSSMVHFEYSDLHDPEAFFAALVVAMRRPDAG